MVFIGLGITGAAEFDDETVMGSDTFNNDSITVSDDDTKASVDAITFERYYENEVVENDLRDDEYEDSAELENIINNVQSGSTIKLSSDYKFGQQIEITKNLTIDGDGHLLDGKNKTKIFNITNGITVHICNLYFINGHFTDYGGAICNEGNLTISNCSFEDNYAGNLGGGAIFNIGNLTVSNSSFLNNHATSGGAISNECNITVSNCSFINNSASIVGGGAIHSAGNGIFSKSRFVNNSATSAGGAISNVGNLTVSKCSFINNSNSNVFGGAICGEGNEVFSNCNFINNSAEHGGAVYNNPYTNFIISNCSFVGNHAHLYTHEDEANCGGAIYNDGGIFIILSNCTFSNNTNNNYEGTIYNHKEGKIIGDASLFNNNNEISKLIYCDNAYVSSTHNSNTTMNIGYEDVYVGRNPVINVYLTNCDYVYGYMDFIITDDSGHLIKSATQYFYNSLASIKLPLLSEGNYSITATYMGNENFKMSSSQKNFSIIKNNPYLSLSVTGNIFVGDTETIAVRFNLNNEENMSVIIADNKGNRIIDENIFNSKNYKFANLSAGEYHVSVSYKGNYKYEPAFEEKNFTVTKINPNLTVAVDKVVFVGDTEEIFVKFNLNTEENMSVIIADNKGNMIVNEYINRSKTYKFSNLTYGDYKVTASFVENYKYLSAFAENNFTVKGYNIKLNMTLKQTEIMFGESVDIGYNTDIQIDEYITILDNGKRIEFDSNPFAYSPHSSGIHNITVLFAGNYKYEPQNVSMLLNVRTPAQTYFDFETVCQDYDGYYLDAYFNATLRDLDGNPLEGRNVTLTFYDVDYARITDLNGKISFHIQGNYEGTSNIKLYYAGEREYESTLSIAIFSVDRNSVFIGAKQNSYFVFENIPTTKAYPGYANIIFTLKDINENHLAGKTVTIYFNGKQYNETTNEKGQITFKISVNNAGSYTITGRFSGSSRYIGSSFTKTIKVVKNSVKFLSPTKKVKKSKSKRTFKITLKTSYKKALSKKIVYVKIKGKTYKAKTNAKGVATFKIKLPKSKKTYKYTAIFKGDAGNNKKTYYSKLKVY